jgi:DNA-binding FadR family transcriptional regulator
MPCRSTLTIPPRYIRLARLLRGQIEDGTYPLGSLLPSATRLAELHTVSKATARHALQVLVKSGHPRHIESKPYQGIWRRAGHDEKAPTV